MALMINPLNTDFLKNVEKQFAYQIITPRKSSVQLLDCIRKMFDLENVDWKIAKIEMENFVSGRSYCDKDMAVYRLIRNEKSELFYKYHLCRFLPRSKIYIMIDMKKNEFICNCSLMQQRINILRGIDESEIELRTGDYKSYLNCIYMYEKEINMMED